MNKQRGFTVIELVAALMILAIVATVAAARWSTPSEFERYSYAEQVRTLFLEAQHYAVRSECHLAVTLSSEGAQLTLGDDCDGGSEPDLLQISHEKVLLLSVLARVDVSPLGNLSPMPTLTFDNGEQTTLSLETMMIN